MNNFQHELDKLDAMTADEIADVLRENNIKGIMRSATNCPIANYLSKVLDSRVKVGAVVVSTKITTVDDTKLMVEHSYGQIAFQGGIYEFVRKFDYGLYPDLDGCQHQVGTRGCLKCGATLKMLAPNKADADTFGFSGLYEKYAAMIDKEYDAMFDGPGCQMPTLNKAVFSGLHNNYTAKPNTVADLVSVS